MNKIIMSLVLMSLIAFSGFTYAETFSYGTYLTASHNVVVDGLKPYFKAVEESTDGSLKFRIFTDSTVVGGSTTLKGIRDGIVDMGTIIPTYTPSRLPIAAALTRLPIGPTNALAETGALNELFFLHCEQCVAEMKKAGITPLAIYSSSPYYLQCTSKANDADSIKGKRIRSTGIWEDWAAAMGGVPVNMTSGEIYSGLNQGTLDCTASPITYLRTFGLKDVIKYVLDMPVGAYRPVIVMDMNSEKWSGLKDKERAAMIGHLADLAAESAWSYVKESTDVINGAKKGGIEFLEPAESMKSKTADFVDSSGKKFVKIAKERGLVDPDKVLENYIRLLDKWKKISASVDSKEDYRKALQENIFSKISY